MDFPLLEYDDEAQRYVALHHPFTAPREEDMEVLQSKPLQAQAQAYDLVLNGFELGGGSIRIHQSDIQLIEDEYLEMYPILNDDND